MARQVAFLLFNKASPNLMEDSVAFAKLILQEHYNPPCNPLFNKDVLSQAHVLELG